MSFRVSLVGMVGMSLLAGCAAPAPTGAAVAAKAARAAEQAAETHVPDFARRPYVPFNREDAVAIALREWRLFGQPVDDDPPGSRPEPPPELKPEREPGLWQRVGEYWWIGLDSNYSEAAWTGKHDADGTEFPAGQDGNYAWSAAFISYVMRTAGAGPRFPYGISHSDYINVGAQMALNQTSGYVVVSQAPGVYAPRLGDLICLGRGAAGRLKYSNLPTGKFPGHCDIVVARAPGELSVLGGNVDDAVTMKHIPTTAAGMIATPDGVAVDTRYPWFVVLKILYDSDTETGAQAISMR
jgi:hypothetical protein